MLKPVSTWTPQPTTTRARRTQITYDRRSNRIAYASGRVVSVRSVDDPSKGWLYTQHTAAVTAVSFAPSGFWVASGDATGQVHVWSPESLEFGEEPSTKGPFAVTSGAVCGITWDFESKRVIAVGDGKERFGHAFMFDSGNSVGEISGHAAAINSVAIRPCRPLRAATVGEDGYVVFYTGAPFRFAKSEKTRHTNAVADVAWSPDGSRFATGGNDRKVALFDGDSGDFLKFVEVGHEASVLSLAWRSPTELISASADCSVRVTDVDSGPVQSWTLSAALSNQQVGVVAVGDDDVVSVSLDGTLYKWKFGEDAPVAVIYGEQKVISGLDVVDGSVISASIDEHVLKWVEGSAERVIQHEGRIIGVSGSFSAGWDRMVRGIDGSASKFVVGEDPVAFSGCSDVKAVITESEIRVIDGPSKPLDLRGLAVDTGVCGGKTTVVVGAGNFATVYSPDLSVLWKSPPQRADVSAVRLSPNGEWLAIGDGSGKILVYSTADWSIKTTRWAFHTSRITSLAWNATSDRCASSSQDSNVYVYSIKLPGRNVKALGAHKDGSTRVAWVSETVIVSGGNDGSIRQWEVPAI